MTYLRNTALTALLVALALPALADGRGANFIAQWDANGDGQVTLDEAQARRADMFTGFDSDGSGALDASELKEMDAASAALREAMQGDRGAGMGRHQDGERGLANGANGMGQEFGPGKGRMQGQGQGMGQGAGPQMAGRHGQGDHDHGQMDADGDGLVTLAEFTGATDSWFAGRDRNGDGVVTSLDFGPRH